MQPEAVSNVTLTHESTESPRYLKNSLRVEISCFLFSSQGDTNGGRHQPVWVLRSPRPTFPCETILETAATSPLETSVLYASVEMMRRARI